MEFDIRRSGCVGLLLCFLGANTQAADTVPAAATEVRETSENIRYSLYIDGSITPHLIPDAAAIAMFTEMLHALSADTQAPSSDFFQKSLGLSKAEFESLQAISREAVQQADAEKADALERLCQDQAFMSLYRNNGNLSAISRELSALDKHLDEDREEFFNSHVSFELGQSVNDSIMGWIDVNLKPVLKVVEFDTEQMATGPAATSPGAVFARNCQDPGALGNRQIATFGIQVEENKK